MQFDIELNADHLTSVLEVVRREIATPKQMLVSLGESLQRVNLDRHNAGLAPDGSKWKELSELTLKEKRKGGILNKTGDMLNSFNYKIQGSDTLRLGFNGNWESKLAFWHHNGTEPYLIEPLKKRALSFGGITVKRVNHPGLPSRPLVGFPVSDQQLTTNVLEDHLTAVLRRAGA
jgi:phage gpG-like protein